jgi:hypothetical protein
MLHLADNRIERAVFVLRRTEIAQLRVRLADKVILAFRRGRHREGHRRGSFGHRNEGRDRLQQPLAMAERRNAQILEIVVCQPTQQLAVDVVAAKHLGILGETDPAEPTVDVQSSVPWLVFFENG